MSEFRCAVNEMHLPSKHRARRRVRFADERQVRSARVIAQVHCGRSPRAPTAVRTTPAGSTNAVDRSGVKNWSPASGLGSRPGLCYWASRCPANSSPPECAVQGPVAIPGCGCLVLLLSAPLTT